MSEQRATVAELWRYPVKSMRRRAGRGVRRVEAGLHRRPCLRGGRSGDRQGRQREAPALVGCAAPVRGAVSSRRPRAGEPLPAGRRSRCPTATETGSEDPARRRPAFGGVRSAGAADDGRAGGKRISRGVARDGRRDARRLARAEHRRRRARPKARSPVSRSALAAPPGTFFDVAALHVLTTATLARLGELEPRQPVRGRAVPAQHRDRLDRRAVLGERLERRRPELRRGARPRRSCSRRCAAS